MPIPPLLDRAADLADRLATAINALSRAVAQIALDGGRPTLSQDQAHGLFLRLSPLVALLVRLCCFGARAPATRPARPKPLQPAPGQPAPGQPAPGQPAPAPRSGAARPASLPRRPGWLLDALPELAPTIAGELRTLLHEADVHAVLALFDTAPFLLRRLRPLLRSLALDPPDLAPFAPKPDPPPAPEPPAPATAPVPAPQLTPNPSPPSPTTAKKPPAAPNPSHAQIVPVM